MIELNDVLGYDLKIFQCKDYFCFSLDSVLLANFITIKKTTKQIMDLGTGNGIIPLILSLRTKSKIYGVDIQQDLIDLALKSVDYNGLSDQINLFCCDLKLLSKDTSMFNKFDIVVSNPPYFSDFDNSKKNINIHKTIARHEVGVKLEDIFLCASRLLKEGGSFGIVYRVDRFIEVIELFKRYNIEPKKVRFIYKNINSDSNMFFVEGIKNGKPGLKILEPFIVYNLDGSNSSVYNNLCKEVLK